MPHLYPLANLNIDERGYFVTCEWEDNSVRVRNTRGKIITYCQAPGVWKPNAAHMGKHGLIFAVDAFAATVFVFHNNAVTILRYVSV